MSNDQRISEISHELIALHDSAGIVAPYSERPSGLTAEAGYRVAAALHASRLERGWKPLGRKIGFTNRTIWPRYGVYEPMWGTVYDRTVVFAQSDRAVISLDGLAQPRIEPEICFRLKAAPPVTHDAGALLEAIEWVAHSIEIVQCHHPDWKLNIADCTADNGLHGRLVVGTPVAVGALPRLAEILARQADSPPLTAGELISTGTLTDAHPVAPGETWRTGFSGLSLKGLEVSFT